jgi:hypothetical protein
MDMKKKEYMRAALADEVITAMSGGGAHEGVITKTSETKEILGFKCVKYEDKQAGGPITIITNYWMASAINNINIDTVEKLSNDSNNSSFPLEIAKDGGFPLMVESLTLRDKSIETISVTKVVLLKKEPVNSSYFAIPSGFKAVKEPKLE